MKNKLSFLTLVSCSALALSTPARAEDTNNEIIVTAQKREQSINDVGLTIQTATNETLLNRGVKDVGDLGKLVPGFVATQSTFATPVYTLRGIGLYDATIGAAPAVALYTDQVPRNFPIMSDALNLDIERVEVLKGPQGTLFGQSSTGGAINYIVGKPTSSFTAGAEVSYERFGKADISGYVSGPITDNLNGRVAIRGVSGGAWQYNISNPSEKNGSDRKLMGRLSLDWTPTDTLSIQTSLTGSRDRSDMQAPQHVNSFYNIYSAASLEAANANPNTRNPYGYVDESLYAALTTPGSPGYRFDHVANQNNAVMRMNGVGSLNLFDNSAWAPYSLADGTRYLLGTPYVRSNRAGSWTPNFLRGKKDYYWQGTVRADLELNDSLTLTSLTSYAEKKVDHHIDLDGTAAVSINVPAFGKINAFNQEVRLTGKSNNVHWLVGANYDYLKTSDNNGYLLYDYVNNDPFGWAATGVGPIQDTLNRFSTTMKTTSLFGNIEYEITDSLSINAGTRYTNNKQNASYCYIDPPISAGLSGWDGGNSIFEAIGKGAVKVNPNDCFVLGDGRPGYPMALSIIDPLKLKQNENNWSWRLGMNYKLNNGGLLYATVSQGYKAGVFSNIGASVISQYVPAKQEKLLSYEGGIKLPINERVTVNGAVFYYDYSNKQVRAKVSDPIWGLLERLVNVPKSDVFGLEGEISATPIDGLQISSSATYVKSNVTKTFDSSKFPVYNNMGFTGNFEGSELPYTPKFMANADIGYEWVMNSVKPFVGGTVFYQGKSTATFKNDQLRADFFNIPSYYTIDLRAGVTSKDGRWKFTVYGRNITNRYIITSPTFYHDAYFNMTGKPATYGISAKWNFK